MTPGKDTSADAARDAVNAASKGEIATTGHRGMLEIIEIQTGEIAKALPMNMDAARYVRTIVTLLRETPKLQECSPPSFLGAVYSAAQLGLEFGPMQQAYILPYGKQAKLIIGYRGWTTLAHRTGEILSITPRTVFENDPKFEVEYGDEDRILHTPLLSPEKGAATHYYVTVKKSNGGRNFVVMSKSEVEYHRDRYGGKKDGKIIGPWADKDQFEPMAWKTCFLKMKAWLPTSIELMQAESVDNHVVRQERVEDEPDIEPFNDEEIYEGEIVETEGDTGADRQGETAWDREDREKREREGTK